MLGAHDHAIIVISRIGYGARGVVFTLLGGFALTAALTPGGEEQDSTQVLQEVLQQPYGRVLLAPLALGLVGYVFWRLVQTIFDTEDEGYGWKGMALRARYLGSALAYTGLAWKSTKSLMDGSMEGGGDDQARGWTAMALSWPGGRWLIGLVGLGILAFALQQARRGWIQDFRKRLDLNKAPARMRRFLCWACTYGFFARAVVFATIAGYLLQAAWFTDPDEARGLGGALDGIHDQPFGPYLLIAMGLGLMGYGVYCFARASIGRVGVPSEDNG